MARKAEEYPNSRIGHVIEEAMEKNNVSIRDLKEAVGYTYEHIRGIIRGKTVPAAELLEVICEFLHMDYQAAEQMLIEDKIRAKFGSIPKSISQKNPELAPIELVWGRLSEAHKKDLISIANSYYKQDRAAGKN